MPDVRVFVVDDSAVARRFISGVIEDEPGLTLAGLANSGQAALDKLDSLQPDLVTLDLEMPGMTGIEVLQEIRREHPRLPVIMLSALTEKGAHATLEALAAGASDYVTKPSGAGDMQAARTQLRNQLVPKIKALCNLQEIVRGTPAPRIRRPRSKRIEIVVIGSSTGGPNALEQVFESLPADLEVPVLIAQHMPPLFTASLAQRITDRTGFQLEEAVDGRKLEPGRGWIAPGDFHLEVAGRVPTLRLNQNPPENSCRPAVDVLFRSVAPLFGQSVLAVVLTGMGQDGLLGCEAIAESGGHVLVQDRESSVVWGMPGAVARAGLAEAELPLESVGPEITRRVRNAGTANTARVS